MKQLHWQCMHLSRMSRPDRPVIRANHGTVTHMQRADRDWQSGFSSLCAASSGGLPTLAPRIGCKCQSRAVADSPSYGNKSHYLTR